MKLPFYIAWRYLFAKKSQNVINIISAISVVGVALGTMALIVVLSVFNGFDTLIKSLFSVFDPDLKIELVEGKTFVPDDLITEQIEDHPGILYYSEILEENALLVYDERQHVVRMKGVDENYRNVSGVDTMIIQGDFILTDEHNNHYTVMGRGVGNILAVGLNFITPVNVYIPSRTAPPTLSPERAFNRQIIFPSGIFSVEQEFDMEYILVPISFARLMLEYEKEVTSMHIKVADGFRDRTVKNDLQNLFGDDFRVLDRYEQHEWLYRLMQTEKWAIFLILTFIILVASFNIIGSLTMLIIEKKKDMAVLKSLGADKKIIHRIFLLEGWMISVAGALTGLVIGTVVCLLQMEYEIIKLYGTGTFIIDAYPVELQFLDYIYVFLAVVFIGFISAWYPSRYVIKHYLSEEDTL